MKKSVRLIITGSVQGIFFRQFIKDHADKHSVSGYLRGLEDGKLEVFLEGQNTKVDEMIAVCKQVQNTRILEMLKKSQRHSKTLKSSKF